METAIDKRILLRMRKELRDLETSPPLGVICYPVDDNIVHLHADISGPEDTPYSTGTFKIDIQIPDRYPFEPPRCQFLTKVYHPNIDEQGRICLDILKSPPKGNWGPAISISTMLISLRLLLATPNPDDPLLADVANEFKENRELFLHKAKEYTERFATGRADAAEGSHIAEGTKVISSRACEIQEQALSSAFPSSVLTSHPSTMIPASAPVSDPSSATVLTASVSFSFPDSPSLSQTKSYSGASDRKVLKKPGLKKPTLGSPGSQEAVSSTAVSEAATRTIRTALVSESDNVVSFITTDQGSAPFEGNDSPGLATSKIVTNQQKITEHAVNVEKTSGLVQISLYPSAKDTVAATDIPISNGKVKRDLEPTMSNKTPLGLTESKSKKLKSNKRGLEKELEMARTKLTQRFKPPSKGGGGGVSIKSVVSEKSTLPTVHSQVTPTDRPYTCRSTAREPDIIPIYSPIPTMPAALPLDAINTTMLPASKSDINSKPDSPQLILLQHGAVTPMEEERTSDGEARPPMVASRFFQTAIDDSATTMVSEDSIVRKDNTRRKIKMKNQDKDMGNNKEKEKDNENGKDKVKVKDKDKDKDRDMGKHKDMDMGKTKSHDMAQEKGKGRDLGVSVLNKDPRETDENAIAGSWSTFNQRPCTPRDVDISSTLNTSTSQSSSTSQCSQGPHADIHTHSPSHTVLPLTTARKRNLLKKQKPQTA